MQVYYGGQTEADRTYVTSLSGAGEPSLYLPHNMAIIKLITDSSVQGTGINITWTAGEKRGQLIMTSDTARMDGLW